MPLHYGSDERRIGSLLRRLPARLAVLSALALASLAMGRAATIHVPADQPTIQAGIDAAANGDTVLVAPGTYKENIDFKGKAITVISSDGAAKTIIDAESIGPGVTFQSGETPASKISGFTIQHGGAFGGGSDALGDIYILNSSPTIVNNTITLGNCWDIYSNYSAPLIQNNEISATQSPQNGCGFGSGAAILVWGGINSKYNEQDANAGQILGNTIENNVESGLSDAGGNGGAGVAVWGGTVLIMNNIIRNNSSPGGSGGAINFVNSIGSVIAQNLIYGNSAGCGGGAIATDGQGLYVLNNTIVDNINIGSAGYSECARIAQIYPNPFTYGFDNPVDVFINNIISGSTSDPAIDCDWFDPPSEVNEPTFQNNVMYNAGGPFFGSHCVDVSHEYGNVNADPQFVNPSANDYHLKSTSPAIDAGQNSVLQTFLAQTGQAFTKDFDGTARVQAVKAASCVIDIGAYEYPGSQTNCVTTETLTSSLNPAMAGQIVTFTAQLSSELGTPTGSIQFLDGTSPLSTVPVSGSGVASFSTSTLAVGSHNIVANYQPTGDFSATSASLVQVINGYTTAIQLTSSLNPSTVGQAVTFAAKVTAGNGTPAGTVQFFDGATLLGTVTLANGVASWTTSTLTAGQHTIMAVYRAQGSDLESQASILQTVDGIATSTTLTATPNPAYSLQTITLTAHVAPAGSGVPAGAVPTGTVTFYDDGTMLGTAVLPGSGAATLITSLVATGTHQLTATYSGDVTFNSSTSAPYAETVLLNTTATTLAIAPDPVGAYLATTLTATLSSSASPSTALTGSVAFSTGAVPLGSAQVVGGKATVTINAGAAGTYPVVATYEGNSSFASSVSPAVNLVVTAEPSTVTLSSSLNPSISGNMVIFTATATAPGTGTSLKGAFTFYDGANPLGTPVATNNGTATFAISTLAVGTHPITAVYSGNASVQGGTSPVLNQVVLAYQGDFSLVVTPGSANLYTGESATFNVVATPQGGFNLPLQLGCSGLPANATCAFAATALQDGSYSTTLVIHTSAPAKADSARGRAGGTGYGTGYGVAALASVFGLLVIPRRLRRRWVRGVWLALALMAVLGGLSACGANGSLTGGTPAGTYTITVAAGTTGVEPQLTHTATINLTVKSLF